MYFHKVKNMVKITEEKLGPVDILVNNAGTWFYTWMKNCHEEEWDTMIDINVKVRLTYSHFLLYLFNSFPSFLRVCSTSLLKTLGKGEITLNELSFLPSVFYPLGELSAIFIKLTFIVC